MKEALYTYIKEIRSGRGDQTSQALDPLDRLDQR
jgi:hypothetical protein